MNNKNKVYILVLFSLILSFSSASASEIQMPWTSTNFDYSDYANVWATSDISESSDEDNGEDADDEVWVNAKINKDLNFAKDWEIWTNVEMVWNILAEKNLSIGTNTVIKGNVIVKWNLKLEPNVEITWYVKVNWDLIIWTNSKIDWTIYGYKKVDAWVNVETNGKLKTAWLFIAGTNYDWVWKIYVFWGKKMWVNSDFSDNKEKWILGKLDAYLKIDITSDEFAEVKKITSSYDENFGKIVMDLKRLKVSLSVANSKLKLAKTEEDKVSINFEISSLTDKIASLKSEWKNLIEKLIIETEQYIETEEFDFKWVNVYLKNEELAKIDLNSATPIKDVVINTNNKVENKVEVKWKDVLVNSSAKNEKLKWSIRLMLEKKLSSYDEDKKSKLYDVLLSKIDKMIEKIDKLKTKNTLILLKEVIEDLKDESSTWNEIDNLFNSLTGDESSTSNETTKEESTTQWTEVKTWGSTEIKADWTTVSQ